MMKKDKSTKTPNNNSNYVSFRDSLYLSDNPEETTFKYDRQLPSLPVPSVKQSLFKLLDSIKPIAPNEAHYRETETKALALLQDAQVNELQEMLKKRASEYSNWLEDWWLEFAYLRSRKPLIPYSNMSAPLPILKEWPWVHDPNVHQSVRRQRAALSTHFQLSFWQMIRQEQMRPMIHKGVPWSMNQFRFLFNTVRRPGEPKDELVSWFKTASEGLPESLEVIVLHKGHIFSLKPISLLSEDGAQVAIMSAPEIERQLEHIEDWCSRNGQGPGVAALTTLERSDWAESRRQLAALSPKNVRILDRIDKALSVLVLDDSEPLSMNEIFRLSMCGDPRNRWADKSISSIAFRNGTFGASADHTPYDGFCTGIMTHYLITSIEECAGQWNERLAELANSSKARNHSEPELLNFELNVQLKHSLEEAIAHFQSVSSTIDTLHETFTHFGKSLTKENKMHPEAFIQCAIHAAYYKQHGGMAPAYVTASTRRFHNGRTETCRSCYPEMKDFACYLSRDNETIDPKSAYELLKRSTDKFQLVMDEASKGQGCDRHLLGLYLEAILGGKKIPELFDDELVQRTNNYVLSTSCSGYWNVCGGVPPLIEEGYGCFYGIEDNCITFGCTAYKSCKQTDVRLFYSNLCESLLKMQKICLNARL